MTRKNHILHNPASEIDRPRVGRTLPKNILSVQEIEQVMMQPNLADALGLQFDRGLVVVRQRKGKKDRYVSIGERATAWLQEYIAEARPPVAIGPDDLTVFLTAEGEPFSRDHLTWTVRVHIVAAKTGKVGACHLLRHCMATHMRENGGHPPHPSDPRPRGHQDHADLHARCATLCNRCTPQLTRQRSSKKKKHPRRDGVLRPPGRNREGPHPRSRLRPRRGRDRQKPQSVEPARVGIILDSSRFS
jgi:hypothetical protein